MEIFTLIDSLEELVVQARRLPVGGNLVVDRKRMLDLVDQLRLTIPTDIQQASDVIAQRDQILGDARAEARTIVDEAEAERVRRLDDSQLVREARERAHALMIDAETRARQAINEADAMAAAHLSEAAEAASRQLDDADAYALEILRRVESQLGGFVSSIRSSIDGLEQQR